MSEECRKNAKIHRKRKNVAEIITISSSSGLYFIYELDANIFQLIENDFYKNGGSAEANGDYESLKLEDGGDSDDIRKTGNKFLIRNIKEGFEVQEITVFLDFPKDYWIQENETDSFGSDSEDDFSTKITQNDSGVESASIHLPEDLPEEPAGNLTKLAVSAGKKMQKLKQNFTISRNEFTKSLGRITRRAPLKWTSPGENPGQGTGPRTSKTEKPAVEQRISDITRTPSSASSVTTKSEPEKSDESSSLRRKKKWLRFRRSLQVDENIHTSIFYLNEMEHSNPQDDLRPVVPGRRKLKVTNQDKFPKHRTTSWYTESGVFTGSPPRLEDQPTSEFSKSCWYAEVGLYDDVTDETTFVQALNLKDEPLYQFYDAGIKKDRQLLDKSDSNIYEEIQFSAVANQIEEESSLNSAHSSTGTSTKVSRTISTNRTLWCELPEVLNSALFESLSPQEKNLQEAKFEILTSEASYLKSLDVLVDHFVANLDHEHLLKTEERRILFGNIPGVRDCSKTFLEKLEGFWQRCGPLLETSKLAEILLESSTNFQVYVLYCENQVLLDTTLRNVCATNRQFFETLETLHTHPITQSLTLHSFLLLPMQRITRLPLLLSTLLHYNKQLEGEIEEQGLLRDALARYTQLAEDCNEATRRVERILEMERVRNELEVPVSGSCTNTVQHWCWREDNDRWLVHSGEVEELMMGNGRKTGRKYRKRKLIMYLFVDVIVLAKKRSSSEHKHTPIHYAPRNFVLTTVTPSLAGFTPPGQHYFLLTILENQLGRTVELLLACRSNADKEKWLEVLDSGAARGQQPEEEEERVYEAWDMPQVKVVTPYRKQRDVEMDLEVGDVLIVEKKLSNGWYYGRNIDRVGNTGWFPAQQTCELPNLHTRSKNLKQRYHLLTYTGLYLQEQK